MLHKIQKYYFESFFLMPLTGFIFLRYFNINIDFAYNLLTLFLVIFTLLVKSRLSIPLYVKMWGLFTLYSILSDVLILGSIGKVNLIQYIYSNEFIATFLLLLLIENTNFIFANIKKYNKYLLVIIIISFSVSIIQIINPLFFVNTIESEKFLNSIIDIRGASLSIYSWLGRNSLGISFVAIFSVFYSQLILGGNKKLFISIIAGIVAFLSKSRYVMLTFLFSLLQRYFTEKNKILGLLRVAAYTVFALLALYIVLKYPLNINVDRIIYYRILEADKASIEQMTAGTRILAFEVFSKVFPEQPLIGAGNQLTMEVERLIGGRSSTIHVGWLYLFYAYGLLGGIPFVLFFYFLMKRLKNTAQKSGFWGSFTAFSTFIIANFTMPYLNIFEMGLVIALIYHKVYEQRIKV